MVLVGGIEGDEWAVVFFFSSLEIRYPRNFSFKKSSSNQAADKSVVRGSAVKKTF